MKHLLIENKGLLDVTLMKLIGASTKTEDTTKIGQFGTGLKYAISYLLRTGNQFKIFIGETEISFELKELHVLNKSLHEIYCDGVSMNITTQYGYQWTAWEILRELWCNAIDEEHALKKVIDGRSKQQGKEGFTRFYIELTEDIEHVVNNWADYFINDTPLYEDTKIAIYRNPGKQLKIYKNHVLVDDNKHYKSHFVYDLKGCDLNELRQYRGYHGSDIGKAIMNSNKEVVDEFIKLYNNADSDVIEKNNIYFSDYAYSKDKIREIFQGYLFLHPESNKSCSGRVVRIPKDLYLILEKCGLSCEKIKVRRSSGYYGGSGTGYETADIGYKEVQNDYLKKGIQRLMRKYKCDTPFVIAASIDREFEVIPSNNTLVFNTELDILADKDLESVVIIGILHSKNTNMYQLMKRFVKIILRSTNFKKILFSE